MSKQHISIIGYPLRHSISPAFQQAALDYYNLDVEYEAWETNPAQLAAAVGELRYARNIGANVTIPFKEEVLNFLDEIDDIAYDIGAVNTIVKDDTVLVGHNTDAVGFMRALREPGKFDPDGKRAVVIGAGGAARAVCYSLLDSGIVALTISNRSRERAEELVEALGEKAAGKRREMNLMVADWQGCAMDEALHKSDLIVNCTSMGMKHGAQEKQSPLTANQIPAGVLVCDLVYNPGETPFLKAAESAGARTLGGLPMLVYQGAAAFELWTGKKAPVETMFEAATAALNER